MERQEFINRCHVISKDWLQFDKRLEMLLDSGAIDLNKVEPNYFDCYPVVAAILERTVIQCIYGSSSDGVNRRQKRKMNNYLKFI
jgi:hypothetical protein